MMVDAILKKEMNDNQQILNISSFEKGVYCSVIKREEFTNYKTHGKIA